MTIQRASNDELRQIEEILSNAGLSSDEVYEIGADGFLVYRHAGTVIGTVATELFPPELFEPAGLLRSLAVSPEWRGRGIGRNLVEAAERSARDAGIWELFLLTTTASSFFASLGYIETRRSAVPRPIASMREFRSLCPESAACMMKSLGERSRTTQKVRAAC